MTNEEKIQTLQKQLDMTNANYNKLNEKYIEANIKIRHLLDGIEMIKHREYSDIAQLIIENATLKKKIQELKSEVKSNRESFREGLLQKQFDKDMEIEELKEQLSKAIVPKFEIGTKLFMIPTLTNGLKEIKDYTLFDISLSDLGIRYGLSLNTKQSGVEPFYSASEEMFGNSIFATKSEAEQKLKG